mmetsp:Transcript_21324/g.29330  ORF Transcript_21324/g.29330 Transcript_21324/m.29330 type:complete len:95 (+) Transcript_21324:25-309(+)
MKWSEDNDKASLKKVQELINNVLDQVKAVDGVKGVQRIVCGGCHDFKIIVSVEAGKFGAWQETGFAPEADFLASVGEVEGITTVETQNYTIAPL